MLHNVGKIDRIVRLVLALVFAILYFLKIDNGSMDSYFMFGAMLLFITSMRRCCPLYALFGFGTCGIQTNEGDEPVIKTKKIKLK
jgi:hypothetical protein